MYNINIIILSRLTMILYNKRKYVGTYCNLKGKNVGLYDKILFEVVVV